MPFLIDGLRDICIQDYLGYDLDLIQAHVKSSDM